MSTSNRGATIIINSGSVDNVSLVSTDKFNKYSLVYVVGVGNRSFQELKRITERLCEKEGLKSPKLPWTVDERTNMVQLRASSRTAVPVADHEGKKTSPKSVNNGEFCKVNVTPAVYKIEEPSSYVTPDGIRHSIVNTKEGVNLFLNGVKLLDSEPTAEDLF